MHAEITHLEGIYLLVVFCVGFGGLLLLGLALYSVLERYVRNKRRW